MPSIHESQELQQHFGNPNARIVTWGLSSVALFIAVFLVLGAVISYPEAISTEIVITSVQPPTDLYAKTNAKLEILFVKDSQMMKSGSPVALLESTANWYSVQALEHLLDGVNENTIETLYPRFQGTPFADLGEISMAYANLTHAIAQYDYILGQDATGNRIKYLRKEAEYTDSLSVHVRLREHHFAEEQEKIRQFAERQGLNERNGVASKQDSEDAQKLVLQAKQKAEDFPADILKNNVRIQQLKGQIEELKKSQSDALSNATLELKRAVSALLTDLDRWKSTYLITAPVNGRIHFTQIWAAHQYVEMGKPLFIVVPEQEAKPYAKASLNTDRMGYLKPGLRCLIEIKGYPAREWGIIETHLGNIPQVTENGKMVIDIPLPDTLLTTYNKVIPTQQNLMGTASILTEERSVLSRIFDTFHSLKKNR